MTTTGSSSAPFTEGKPFWMSRGVIGAAVVILAVALRHMGWDVDQGKLADDISASLELIGGILALYGRIKADQPIVWTRGTVPGGTFNPAAEVRKAEPVNKEEGSAVLQALCALAACSLIGMLLASCHPTAQEVITPSRDPQIPVVHHPSIALDLIRSLRVTPSLDVMTNRAGKSIPVVTINVNGGVEF